MLTTILHRVLAALYFGPADANAGAGGAAGAGSPGAAGAGNPPAAGGPDAAAGGAAAAAAGGTPAVGAGAEKIYTFKEDRSAWIDPERYKKAEAAVNRTAAELTRAHAEIAEHKKRIAALAGVTPPNPQDAEADKIAEAFFALPQFAHLKYLTPELLQSIAALVQDGASIQDARDHVWNAHTDRFLSRLDESFAGEIGVETLTAGQQRKLHAAFGALIPDERADPDAYATFKRRYEAGDQKLIDDFVTEYVADMLEPARRQATMTTRRPVVPRSGPAAPVVTQRQKPDYSQMTVAQMLEHAEKEAEAVGR